MMEEQHAKDVYQYLIKKLPVEQKKAFIRGTDIKFGTMQKGLIKTDQQWKAVIKILESKAKLKTNQVQKEISDFYLNHIVPGLKGDMDDELELISTIEDLTVDELVDYIQQKGLDYILMIFVLRHQYDKAKDIVDKYEVLNTPIDRISKETKTEKQSQDIAELSRLNHELTKKNNTLGEKNDKNKTVIIELEKVNRNLKEELELEKRENKAREKKLSNQIKLIKQDIDRMELEYEKFKINLENESKKIIELKEEKITELETAIEQTSNLNKLMLESQIESVEEHTINKETLNKRVLVFGELPYKTKPGYTIKTFNDDYSNYEFNEIYDEYWCVIDKLSGLNKRQLRKNSEAKNIELILLTYLAEMNKTIIHREYVR
jgi:hypothetical protein